MRVARAGTEGRELILTTQSDIQPLATLADLLERRAHMKVKKYRRARPFEVGLLSGGGVLASTESDLQKYRTRYRSAPLDTIWRLCDHLGHLGTLHGIGH